MFWVKHQIPMAKITLQLQMDTSRAIESLALASQTINLLTFQRHVIALRWVDTAILTDKNPIIAKYQREREFPSRNLAIRCAKAMLKRGECWGDCVELSIVDRQDGNTKSRQWTHETIDITLSGLQGKWTHSGQATRQAPGKRTYLNNPKYLAVMNVTF